MFLRIAALAVVFLATPDLRAQEPDLSGSGWSGYWASESSGHSGPLRATFTRIDADHYRVVFHGRFFKVIPFRYAQVLTITGYQGDKVLLSGSSRLLGFGTFEYSATASGCNFVSTYCSRNDHGTFTLSR